jgi:hypothetical protein
VETARVAMKPEEASQRVKVEWREELLGGMNVLRTPGLTAAATSDVEAGEPISPPLLGSGRPAELTMVPFYARANRSDDSRWVVFIPSNAAGVRPTIAARSTARASHVGEHDTVRALHDQVEPTDSSDKTIPRFTWWDHRGTKEWAEYRLPEPTKISAAAVYWFDDAPTGGDCRVPASWSLHYRDSGVWKAVTATGGYGVAKDTFNRTPFKPVMTDALRLEVQLKPGYSAGILEWRVE